MAAVSDVSLWLTVGLCGRAVGVAEGQQSRLHQLREEDILPDQDKLCVLLSSLTPVCLNPSIRLLHHTEDWDHQTCGGRKQQEDSLKIWILLSVITTRFIPHRQQTCGEDLLWVRLVITSSFVFYTVEYGNTWNSQYNQPNIKQITRISKLTVTVLFPLSTYISMFVI